MKLNLGSNDVRVAGFLNVDIRKAQNVDIVDNVLNLESIKEDSVEAIIAHNILEHIAPDKTMTCLNLWVSKLQKGGSIQIGVPDGLMILERFQKGVLTRKEYKDCPWKDVIHSMFGNMSIMRDMHGDEAEKYMHHIIFSEDYLRYCLEEAGITDIKKVKANHKDNITLKGIKA